MKLMSALGYAGLIPFVVLPLCYRYPPLQESVNLLLLYQLYSALILGFMAGVLWPALYVPDSPAAHNRLALLAVSFPVLSIVVLAAAPDYFILMQALLFVLLRLAEQLSGINQRYTRSYRNLRNHLTVVVTLSHLLLFYLLQ